MYISQSAPGHLAQALIAQKILGTCGVTRAADSKLYPLNWTSSQATPVDTDQRWIETAPIRQVS